MVGKKVYITKYRPEIQRLTKRQDTTTESGFFYLNQIQKRNGNVLGKGSFNFFPKDLILISVIYEMYT